MRLQIEEGVSTKKEGRDSLTDYRTPKSLSWKQKKMERESTNEEPRMVGPRGSSHRT
jgi:hypothetical protein